MQGLVAHRPFCEGAGNGDYIVDLDARVGDIIDGSQAMTDPFVLQKNLRWQRLLLLHC